MPSSHTSRGSRSASAMGDVGSTPSERINSTTAASGIARSASSFSIWANSVSLVPPPDEEPTEVLPPALKALMDTSEIIPPWTRDPQASQYDSIRRRFSTQIPALSVMLGAPFTTSDDQGLSEEVEYALAPIFEGVTLMRRLGQHFNIRPNEADRRLMLDYLSSQVWNNYDNESLIHKLECAVQLPRFGPVQDARPDSSVFFRLKQSTIARLPAVLVGPCSSVARREGTTVHDYVLHWVTEYKGAIYSGASKRQAWMAMTSGLYQRRSLGFKDHFVFGTAYHSDTSLTVYAGQWETRSGEDQIIIYTLDTFQMDSHTEMLQYFLLMRDARRLALEYKESMDERAPELAMDIYRSQPNVHSWMGPQSKKRGRDESTSEAQGAPSGSVPRTGVDADSHAQQPVHVFGVVDPFIHRFAEELSENGESAKVRGYLISSVHDTYNYQVDDDRVSYL